MAVVRVVRWFKVSLGKILKPKLPLMALPSILVSVCVCMECMDVNVAWVVTYFEWLIRLSHSSEWARGLRLLDPSVY